MTHHDDACTYADLLARLGDDGTKELFRRLLEEALQELIDAELTSQIGADRHQRSDARVNYWNGVRATRDQLRQVVGMLEVRYPAAAETLAEAEADVTSYADFPKAHWRKIASSNPLERVHKEIKRSSNAVGIFPDDQSVLRLVGAVLAEVHDDWQTGDRRYLSEGSMKLIGQQPKEVTISDTPAFPTA